MPQGQESQEKLTNMKKVKKSQKIWQSLENSDFVSYSLQNFLLFKPSKGLKLIKNSLKPD